MLRCFYGNRVIVATAAIRKCGRWLHGERRPIERLLPFEMDTKVACDVLLFRYENARFYRILNVFAVSQLVFWSCTAHFMNTANAPQSGRRRGDSDVAGRRNWFLDLVANPKLNSTTMAVTCVCVGFAVAFGTWFFTRRTVRHLTLLRGGQRVRLTCYSPWPLPDRVVEVPLDHLSFSHARTQFSHKSLSIKGHRLFYVLDRDGQFTNTKLFDNTVGLKRSWAKTTD